MRALVKRRDLKECTSVRTRCGMDRRSTFAAGSTYVDKHSSVASEQLASVVLAQSHQVSAHLHPEES